LEVAVNVEQQAVEINHKALQRIVALLWTMAGLGRRQTILRSLHRTVTRLLRPAEAAARRLIVVLARGIVVALPPSRTAAPRPARDRAPVGWKPFALAETTPRLLDPSRAPRPFPGIVRIGGNQEVSATRLAFRLDALCHALDDLEAQAERLARWRARRRRARERGVFCTIEPLRLGPPPDLRGRAGQWLKSHELFGILKQTHERAWWAQHEPQDTS
jgi:hypothetical protein